MGMAERIIRTLGDPVLRSKSRPVPAMTSAMLKLLDDMAQTIYAGPNRSGLAAPQIGIAKRISVMDCGDGLIELINPEIIDQSGEQEGWEACLSIPGIIGRVKRATHVTVRTWNRSGEEMTVDGEGYLARCMQHEIDHLNGILFIDHVDPGQLFDESGKTSLDVMKVIRMSHAGITPTGPFGPWRS